MPMSTRSKSKAKVRDTSQDYDTCIGKIEEDLIPGSLASFIGEKEIPQTEEEAWKDFNHKEWKQHWKGMPSFVNEDQRPVKQLIISFAEEADVDAFAKLIGQEIKEKTKSIWFPKKAREQNTLKRYLEDVDL